MNATDTYNTAKESAYAIYAQEASAENYNTRAIAMRNLNTRLEAAYLAYELAI